jgi:bacillolysin
MPYLSAMRCCVASLVVALAAGATPVAGASSEAGLGDLAASSTRPLIVRQQPGRRAPFFVAGRIPTRKFSAAAGARGRADAFWRSFGAVFGLDGATDDLRLLRVTRDGLGTQHVRYRQVYEGLPVFGRQAVVHLEGDVVYAVNGELHPDIAVPTEPAVTSAAATGTALESLAKRLPQAAGARSTLLVFVDGSDRAHLAWRVSVPTASPLGLWRVFVDARSGELISAYDDLETALNRSVYNNANDLDCNYDDAPVCVLPGSLLRAEGGGAVADADANAAYEHAGTVYNFYNDTFGWDSIDGSGGEIRSTVNFGVGFGNAFWCGNDCIRFFGGSVGQMAYGDGDGTYFGPLAQDLDVVAHELTHAVTENTANLVYEGQSGALNESYSDVMAAMVDTGDWTIGEDSWTPGAPGDALRDLADPGAGGQPAVMADYVHTVYDNGGVHINSGIPNHAAYLLAADPDYGIDRAATQGIYFRALSTYLTPTADFVANLNALLQAAEDIHGAGSAERAAVARANAAVGITNRPAVTSPNGGETLEEGTPATIQWTNAGLPGLAYTVEAVRRSGPTHYQQGFESSASLPSGFSSGGNASWFVTTSSPGSGTFSARSGVIGDDGRSTLSLTRTLGQAGNVTFKARVSSEAGYDFFSFYVDGVRKILGSGNIAWQSGSVPVSAGRHTLTWIFERDVTLGGGSNAAWIDDVSVPNSRQETVTTVAALTAAGAVSESWTPGGPPDANYVVRVRVPSAVPWLGVDYSNATFTVASPDAPPQTTITSHPPSLTRNRWASLAFRAYEGWPGGGVLSGATFECRRDGGPWASCASPRGYSSLGNGLHTFSVRASYGGVTDATPASFTWRVDATAPGTRITSGPQSPTRSRRATFRFTATEADSTFLCSLDGRAFRSCKSPKRYTGLSRGRHTLRVKAKDRAGNVDRTPATRVWRVRR